MTGLPDRAQVWRLPLRCHHRRAKTMLMKEYRICMPLTVEEVGEVFLLSLFCFLHSFIFFFKSASQLIHTELQVKRACFDLTSSLYRWADYWSCLRCARVLVPKDIMSSYNRGQAATAGWSCCCLFKTRVWVQEMLCDAERLCTATAEGIVRILGSKEVLVLQLDYFKCLYDLCFCVHSSYLPSFPGQNTI